MKELSIFEYSKKNNFKIFSSYIGNECISYSEFNNIYIDTSMHSIITNDFLVFSDFERFKNPEKYKKKHIVNADYVKDKLKNVRKINEPCFYLGCENNYWHQVKDFIPKLYILKKNEKFHNFKLAINANLSNEYLDILNFFLDKFKLNNIELLRLDDEYYKFEKVIISSCPLIDFSIEFFNSINKSQNKPNINIYISRKLASKRKITNESEIIDILKKYNYEIVYCENIPFVDQVKLFSLAKNIVAPHGAGLTNLFWSKSNTTILELSSQIKQPFFETLSKHKKMNFIRIIGQDDNTKFYEKDNHKDYSINLKLLKSVIEKYKLF